MALLASTSDLAEDDAVLIDGAREYARAELLPLDRKWDQDDSSVTDILDALAEMGFLGLCVPSELDGLGCSCTTYAAITHELSYASPSVAVTISVHSMVGRVLKQFAAEPLRSDLLREWGNPGSLAAFAISEAESGSDAGSAKTSAVEVDGGFRLTGEKMWITNGLAARWFLVLARLAGGDNGGRLCAFLVDGRESGIERTPIHGKMGIRGSETAVVHFDETFVPSAHLIGDRGDGLAVCLSALNEGRIGIAAQASGIGKACLDEMVRYAGQRYQFGRPIGKLQAVANMIADSATELEASKLLIRRAAHRIDDGLEARSASAMAKLYASESANRIAYRAVQVHGGSGYVHECRVEQLYRDARVTTIYEGTSEIQRIVIGRGLKNAS